MLVNFFTTLRKFEIPVTLKELLVLFEALQQRLAFASVDDFYLLSRTCLVKDEKYFDSFDCAFGAYFKDLESVDDILQKLIPEDWLRGEFAMQLTDEEKAKIESLGGLEKLIEEFRKRLVEQEKRHEGGSRWIGTGGTSPFGNSGYNPEGVRVDGQGGNKKAVKVWQQRQFRDLDDSVELGTRNIKVALRRLRKFARSGAEEELDLNDTIRSTARDAGLLNIKMVPERHNAIKVLLFFDIGGSMDPYVRTCEELFSAARTEFKHLKYFYFHNCLYESVWQNNLRRMSEITQTFDILHTYSKDYKVIFVGDAAMAPYELMSIHGSAEHMNNETGINWLKRVVDHFDKVIWLNPEGEQYWGYTQTIGLIKDAFKGKMYPLTLEGLEQGMQFLSK